MAAVNNAASPPHPLNARQAAGAHVQAALLPHLPPAGLPRRLAVRFHDATGDRPAGFVRRLEDQQAALAVEDQRSGGCGDGRKDLQAKVAGGHEASLRAVGPVTGARVPDSPRLVRTAGDVNNARCGVGRRLSRFTGSGGAARPFPNELG